MPLILIGTTQKPQPICHHEHDLDQVVQEPTRCEGNTYNILDLVFSNNATLLEMSRLFLE